ncbi:hypothetical protein [Paraburkholderia rhynchosiae]|uniref:DUF1364 domain-containing protein n=1 Tax=Paraburkholderia rhynchosiae TaxID=487049 RepID=A0A2N7W9A9_9BURK|nr:hypothetical protein [Paraburkholderia rhynchosiae]PMS25984.1 hypothetical protein C0Z16_28025 [Paraburkholderia rhynchosiae]CAB3730831.1 hypothetical protein LMG27174_05782 [Paraburkholderia rhynchosiae]
MTARLIFPKTLTFRCEDLRRAVAQLPCMCCGISGHTQAAHMNLGKGAGIKASDAALAALCADRPGVRGCHSMLDQGGVMEKHERRVFEAEMVCKTYIALVERGHLVVAE